MQDEAGKLSRGEALSSLQRRTRLTAIAVYPLLHIAAVWVGLLLSSGTQTATLWASNALLLSFMVILGRRSWLPLLGGVIVAEALTVVFFLPHLSLGVAVFFSAANMLEALIAALLWQGLVKGQVNVLRLRDSILLIFVVAAFAPAISGLLAGLGRIGLGDAAAFFWFWQLWWSANALGILIITTAAVAWASVSKDDWHLLGSRWFEFFVLTASVVGITQWVFGSEPGSASTVLGLPYVVFPLLVWSTVRFGTRVSATLVFLIAVVSIINTDSGYGPFAIPSYTEYQRVLTLQMFLAAAAISVVCLGAAFSERSVLLHRLKGSEDKFSKAFHSSPDAICICRLSDGEVLEVNRSFHTITGWAPVEAVGASLRSLSLLPLENQRRKYLEQDEAPEQVVFTSASPMLKSGSTRECEISCAVAEIDGDECMVAILHDLTLVRAQEGKRRALEAKLTQARKMEAIGHLTGGIAHDFNNILYSILGNTELAESRAVALHDRELMGYLGEIRQGGVSARDLVAQLLAFGRSELGDPIPVDISGSVKKVLGLLKQVVPSGLEINTFIKTPEAKVLADPMQLERAIMNLCINARDATGGEGTVEIEINNAVNFRGLCSSCQEPFEGDFVRLSICDSGPGIDPELQGKIFQPFYSSKDVGKGSGLGLSIVHRAIHASNGHIVVASEPGETSISSFLPLLTVGASEVDASPADTPPIKEVHSLTGKVLLVDDDDSVRNVTVQILQRSGLTVTAVSNGVDALSRFEADPDGFDLVITDQTMPKMTGATLARKMLDLRPDLPVILCSGYSPDIDERQARELGLRGFHQKPVDFPKLLRAIEQLLGAS